MVLGAPERHIAAFFETEFKNFPTADFQNFCSKISVMQRLLFQRLTLWSLFASKQQ
jgi:hypothetical protein